MRNIPPPPADPLPIIDPGLIERPRLSSRVFEESHAQLEVKALLPSMSNSERPPTPGHGYPVGPPTPSLSVS